MHIFWSNLIKSLTNFIISTQYFFCDRRIDQLRVTLIQEPSGVNSNEHGHAECRFLSVCSTIRQTSTDSVSLQLISAVWHNSPLELRHVYGFKMAAPTKTPWYRVLSEEYFNVWSCSSFKFIRISLNKWQFCNENSKNSTNDTLFLGSITAWSF